MANSPEPVVGSANRMTALYFWLIVNGFYIWEFLLTLDLEWNVIRGRRPYRWTIWIYSLTRLVTLAVVAVNILSLNSSDPINCQVTIDLQFILSYHVLVASSLLIVLRVIAIWDRNRTIVAIAIGIWVINVVLLIQGAVRVHSSWDSEINDCVLYLDGVRLSTISAFVTDITLLLIMLFGLYRMRRYGGLMAVGRLLWNQGIVWLSVAVVAELAPTVLICLDIHGPFKIIFLIPWVITMSTAATRMYRSLSDFMSPDVSQESLPTSDRTVLEGNGTRAAPTYVAGVQVSVHKAREQPSMSLANHFGSDITGQPHVKPDELTVDLSDYHDIESGSEN